MSITPEALLKKLKPTAKFALEAGDIGALARLAIDLGEVRFVEVWQAQHAKPVRKPARTRSPARRKAVADPAISEAINTLKAFADSRKLKSSEMATAYIGFAADLYSDLPKPTKTALAGLPGSVKWMSQKKGAKTTLELAAACVAAFSKDTDFTYSS